MWGISLCLMFFFSMGLVSKEIHLPNQFGFEVLQQTEEKRMVVYDIQYGRGHILKSKLLRLYPELTVIISPDEKQLLIRSIDMYQEEILSILEVLDQPVIQHDVSLEIIEIAISDLDQLKGGLSVFNEGILTVYSFNDSVDTVLGGLEGFWQFLSQNDRAKVLATPRLVIQNHHLATIQVGDKIPYITRVFHNSQSQEQLNYLDSGIQLDLKVTEVTGNQVLVDLKASIALVKLWKQLGEGTYPVLSKRLAETQICLKKDTPFLIAGLLAEDIREQSSKVPLLGDLPLIGTFFRSESIEFQQSDVVLVLNVKSPERLKKVLSEEKKGGEKLFEKQ